MTYISDARAISDARSKPDLQRNSHQRRTAPRKSTGWRSARGEPPATVHITWGVDVHDTTIVDVTGELCTVTAERVRQLFRTIAETSVADVAVDMSEVTFLDCRGLSLFLRAQSRLGERGLRCRVVSPSPVVRRLFDRLSLEDHLCGRGNLGNRSVRALHES